MASHVITHRADIRAGRAQSTASRGLAELFARLNLWLEQRRHYRTTVAKLNALPDQVLADIGVRRGEIESIAARLARQARGGR
ncbi:MAG: hypothetical protein K0R41_4357 [Geminicoccaceae bacterium]|jgi:uncharacterized protein YjiS (DUF1127 family)|nr:hypothetical protein [Geminicoccaceae bacterium]